MSSRTGREEKSRGLRARRVAEQDSLGGRLHSRIYLKGGAAIAKRVLKYAGHTRRRADLAERFKDILETLFEGRLLDWTVADSRVCARVMEEKRRRGEPLDDHLPDAMLAGLAVNRKLTVVTRNEKDFRNTGTAIIDP